MSQNSAKPKQFTYRVNLKWREGRRGVLSSLGKPDIVVAPPPEFKGYVGVWTPEDMLISAVNSCYMLTFLYFINRDEIDLVSFQCDAEGTLESLEGKLQITYVKLSPQISVRMPEQEKAKMDSLMRLSKENCFVSNSIKGKVDIVPDIKYVP